MFFDATVPSLSLCGTRNRTQHLTHTEAGIYMVSCVPCLGAFSYEMQFLTMLNLWTNLSHGGRQYIIKEWWVDVLCFRLSYCSCEPF